MAPACSNPDTPINKPPPRYRTLRQSLATPLPDYSRDLQIGNDPLYEADPTSLTSRRSQRLEMCEALRSDLRNLKRTLKAEPSVFILLIVGGIWWIGCFRILLALLYGLDICVLLAVVELCLGQFLTTLQKNVPKHLMWRLIFLLVPLLLMLEVLLPLSPEAYRYTWSPVGDGHTWTSMSMNCKASDVSKRSLNCTLSVAPTFSRNCMVGELLNWSRNRTPGGV